MTTITMLTNSGPYIEQIAKAHFDRWGKLTTKNSETEYAELLKAAANNATQNPTEHSPLPITLIATHQQILQGSVNLMTHELPTHTHLTPWLAHLYVFPEARKQSIAKQLINATIEQAKQRNHKTLTLFATGTMPDYYQNLGWQTIEILNDESRPKHIMQINF